ncbi:MAG: ankyrin repeat domain-containing protein [Akkermansia sp.]|nr:ankyrin repeat domain-containing protein [Akkermansia sp.]
MKGWYGAGFLSLLAAAAVWLPTACEKHADDPQPPAGQGNTPAPALSPNEALIYHAAHGNAGGVAQALDNGADIESRDENGLTPLMWAAQQQVAAVVGLLLQRGANPYLADKAGWTALHCAASSGSLDGMQLLLKSCRESLDAVNAKGETPLMLALRMHREDIARALVNAGADIRATDREGLNTLDIARSEKMHGMVKLLHDKGLYPSQDRVLLDMARDGRVERLQRFFKDHPDAEVDVRNDSGMTPLMFAAAMGHLDCMEFLIAAGADVGAREEVGMTPLLFAALEGRTEALELLLRHGASLKDRTRGGWSPLLLAVGHRHTLMVQALVDRGADIDEVNDEGATALHVAATNGQKHMVVYLIKRGASLEVADSYGWTPLMVAAAYGQAPVVETLLEAGADVSRADANGWAPIHCAASSGSPSSLAMLVRHGADPRRETVLHHGPLFIAAGLGHTDAVRYLVEECRLPVDTADAEGWTPLMHAASLGQAGVVEYLLRLGADATRKTARGETVRQLADMRGQQEVLRVLDDAGITE